MPVDVIKFQIICTKEVEIHQFLYLDLGMYRVKEGKN